MTEPGTSSVSALRMPRFHLRGAGAASSAAGASWMGGAAGCDFRHGVSLTIVCRVGSKERVYAIRHERKSTVRDGDGLGGTR